MQALTLNESFKAFVREAFPDKSEVVAQIFEEVINDRATTTRIGLDELKGRAIDEIKGEFVTKDFVRAEIAEVRAEMASMREELMGEIAKSKLEVIKWVVGLQVATTALLIGTMLKLMN